MNHKRQVGRKSFACHYDLKKNEVPVYNKLKKLFLWQYGRNNKSGARMLLLLCFFLYSESRETCYSPLGNLDRNLPDQEKTTRKRKYILILCYKGEATKPEAFKIVKEKSLSSYMYSKQVSENMENMTKIKLASVTTWQSTGKKGGHEESYQKLKDKYLTI